MANVELLEALGIDLKRKNNGSLKTTCPKCSESRRNKKDPCLSVDIDSGVYNCHHCDFHGRVFEKKLKEYVKPPARLEKLSKKRLDWLESERKISNNTLLRLKITESMEFMPQIGKEVPVICFNYFRGEELVNIKFRGPSKSFMMAKDAELIFYNLNSIDGEDTAVIVEGEIDLLSMYEAGIYTVVSVPNGASKGNQKLEYLDNCWEYFRDMKKVILAVDDDDPGRSLREELARRLGKEKCWTVEYPEGCKDANEVLVKHGKEMLAHMVENARQWPLEGIMAMDDIFPTVKDWFEHGYPEGTKAGVMGFDHLMRFDEGKLTVFTGIPGHGKDEFFNLLMASLAKNHKWPIGYCGFEETPAQSTSKLQEKLTGKSFNFRKDKSHRMTSTDFEWSISLIDQFFHFYNTDESALNVDGLLEIAAGLVKRYGIRMLYFSPWNCIEHRRPEGTSETEYAGQVLLKFRQFARMYGVHVVIIAHTTKIQVDKKTGKFEVPNLYHISGSANFYNMPDFGGVVYRDFASGLVDVYIKKVKQSWLGQTGFSSYHYNTMTRQYEWVKSEPSVEGDLPKGNWKPLPAGTIDHTESQHTHIDDDDHEPDEQLPF
jgi:twinkle protein